MLFNEKVQTQELYDFCSYHKMQVIKVIKKKIHELLGSLKKQKHLKRTLKFGF